LEIGRLGAEGLSRLRPSLPLAKCVFRDGVASGRGQFFHRPSMPKKFLLRLFVRVKKNVSRLKKRLALGLMAV